jgi:hypothetical protein
MKKMVLLILAFNISVAFAQQYEDLIPMFKDGKYYYADNGMVIVSKTGYDWASLFYETTAFVKQDGKYSLINHDFKQIGESKFDAIGKYSEHVIPVKANGKWAYMASNGRVLCNYIFDTVLDWHNGLGVGRIGSSTGIVNTSGELVYIPNTKPLTTVEQGHLLLLNSANKKVLMNEKGKEVILAPFNTKPEQWKPVGTFAEGVLPVLVETKGDDTYGNKATGKEVKAVFTNYQFIDNSGNVVIPKIGNDPALNYELVNNFIGDWALVKEWNNFNPQRTYKVLYKSGAVAGDFSYIYAMSKDYILAKDNVSKDIKIYDVKLNILGTVELRLTKTGNFSEDAIAVYDDIVGAWGYLTQQGLTKIQFRYDEANEFQNGMALVKLKGKWLYISNGGKEYKAE